MPRVPRDRRHGTFSLLLLSDMKVGQPNACNWVPAISAGRAPLAAAVLPQLKRRDRRPHLEALMIRRGARRPYIIQLIARKVSMELVC